MSLCVEQRQSNSPYVESIMHGWTTAAGASIRPAETHWHMIFVREQGNMHPIVVGALTAAGIAQWREGAEILWLKFKLGTYMPHVSQKAFLNRETILPSAASQSFWLKGSVWQFPNYNTVDTFVDRLVRNDLLVWDPVVRAMLQDQPQAIAPRTARHRFLHATGLTLSHIRQVERAQQAADLLQRGISISDATYALGYYDQPHMTRSLKHLIGYTPSQIAHVRHPASDRQTIQVMSQ